MEILKMGKFNRGQRSLGGLRDNAWRNGNLNAPEGIGRILIHRDLIASLSAQLQSSKNDFVEASIASWLNKRKLGNGVVDEFLTVEINALNPKDIRWWKPEKPAVANLEDFFQ
jgi:hypothetical protein